MTSQKEIKKLLDTLNQEKKNYKDNDINNIVETLRTISKMSCLKNHNVLFVENEFGIKNDYLNISKLIYYIADMIEE